jgi:hypothetical protein
MISDDDFLGAVESGEAPDGQFHHSDHVRLAWLYLNQHPLLEAIARFCATLKRFAAANGKPGLYHETITWSYLLLIHDRMQRQKASRMWEEFVQSNQDLLDRRTNILLRYYSQEILNSPLARRCFVFPDRFDKTSLSVSAAKQFVEP